LLDLQLCEAPHRFYDPYQEVNNIFLSFRLNCLGHVPDPLEERFQDVPNYLDVLRKNAVPKKATQTRAITINVKESLFRARDRLIRGLAAASIRAEEEKEKERVERWEKYVATQKKKTEPTQGIKLSLPSQGVRTSVV